MTNRSENVDIAVLQNEIKTFGTSLTEMKSDLKEVKDWISQLENRYVTRDEFKSFKSQYWLSHTLTAILTIIITVLVYFYFSHGTTIK